MIPESILRHIQGRAYTSDSIGKSGSEVRIYDDSVLKIVKYDSKNDEKVRMMRWMSGRLRSPEVICWDSDGEHQYLLMSRVTGEMCCTRRFLEQPKELVRLLAEAVRQLWDTDISDCPVTRNADTELKEARFRVENGLVDIDNVEPSTFGEGGFKDPADLLTWLERNKPSFEPALSHGDLCLPNILIDGGKIGYIDIGDAGIGDKWRDLALLSRSLRHNTDGTYGMVYPGYYDDMLFDELGIAPDREKLRYYTLLDELF